MEENQNIIAWHAQSVKDVLASLGSSKNGLSELQVKEALEENGENTLPKQKKKSIFILIWDQFKSPLMIILIFAGMISAALGEWFDCAIITLALLVNAVMGFFEELKADRSMLKLQSLLERHARVRRGGVEMTILAKDLVPGDIVLIASGDKISADGRVIFSSELSTNEAALTGESNPQVKESHKINSSSGVSDQSNMVFGGTVVVGGFGEYIVTGTGLNTQIGEITKLVAQTQEDQTPFQKQMNALAKWLGVLVLCIAFIAFVVGLLRGVESLEMFEIAVALAVAAVPEGLVVVVTIILVIGMQRILKRDAIVRRLVAAETLGSVSVICTDKTGTLTTGEMTVSEVRLGCRQIDVREKEGCSDLHEAILLTNHSRVEIDPETGKPIYHGSVTENAMRRHFDDITAIERDSYEIDLDLPFDRQSKFSAVVAAQSGKCKVLAFGSPEQVMELCDMSDGQRKKYTEVLEEMTGRGLRVLMAAGGGCGIGDIQNREDIKDLKPLGFVGLKDPVRESAKQSLLEAKSAGVHTVLVTGDHRNTAVNIAREVGLEFSEEAVMEGVELDDLTEEQFLQKIESIAVYARVLPRHKMRIIRAWQSRGASVAMTGDGVNDAPAIKAADIGIALGSGTEVAKETSDMVLLNNDFRTIVSSIKEGRILFDNIRKVVIYLLSDAFGEMALVLAAIIFKSPLPLLATQILWINLISDGPAAVALAFEKGEKDVMRLPPRGKKDPIINSDIRSFIALLSGVTAITLIGIYFLFLQFGWPIEEVRTFIYLTLGLDTLLYVFSLRTMRTPIWRSKPWKNPWLIAAVFIGFILLLVPMFVEPLKTWFEFTSLNTTEWILAVGFSVYVILLIETGKFFLQRKFRRKIEQKQLGRV